MPETIYTAINPGDFAEKKEKHIPVATVDGTTVHVKVGEEEHPMEPVHYIEWIALYRGEKEIVRKNLQPGEKPEAIFENVEISPSLRVREHCNLHGTWEAAISF